MRPEMLDNIGREEALQLARSIEEGPGAIRRGGQPAGQPVRAALAEAGRLHLQVDRWRLNPRRRIGAWQLLVPAGGRGAVHALLRAARARPQVGEGEGRLAVGQTGVGVQLCGQPFGEGRWVRIGHMAGAQPIVVGRDGPPRVQQQGDGGSDEQAEQQTQPGQHPQPQHHPIVRGHRDPYQAEERSGAQQPHRQLLAGSAHHRQRQGRDHQTRRHQRGQADPARQSIRRQPGGERPEQHSRRQRNQGHPHALAAEAAAQQLPERPGELARPGGVARRRLHQREQWSGRSRRLKQLRQVGSSAGSGGLTEPPGQTGQLREAAQFTLTTVLGCGCGRGGDCPRRGAPDISEPVHPGQLAHRQRVDDTAGDTALHDDVALPSRAGVAPWVGERCHQVVFHPASPPDMPRRPSPCRYARAVP
jgi:hypothetical protein